MGKAVGRDVALMGVDEIFRGEGRLLQDDPPIGGGDSPLAKAQAEGIVDPGWRRTPAAGTHCGVSALSPRGTVTVAARASILVGVSMNPV